MSAEDTDRLTRENVYLKQRCALLEDDVANLTAQVTRLGQQLERFMQQRDIRMSRPNALSGGQ